MAGFPLFDEGGLALDAELSAFLDAGAAPVGVTPGSAMAHGERFFARAIEACRAAQRRAVLVSPYRERLPRVLPAGCHHVTWAPFSRLLPRLSALIHHGGIGTCAQALAAGIPQLVVPFAYDQFDNAARLQRRGVGLTGDASAPAARWTATLLRLLDDPAVAAAARRDAQSMTDRGLPARSIAARLEQLGRMRH